MVPAWLDCGCRKENKPECVGWPTLGRLETINLQAPTDEFPSCQGT